MFVVLNMFHCRWFDSTMMRELRRTLVWTCTLQMSVRHVLSNFVNWYVSAALRMMNQQKILVRSFAASRVDYSKFQLGPSLCSKEGRTHVATGSEHCRAVWSQETRKQERGLSCLLPRVRDDLHRLTIPQRLQYKLVVTVHQCLRYTDLQGAAYQSLMIFGRQHIRSASDREVSIPRMSCNTYGTPAFSVAVPTVWILLSESLRDRPSSILNALWETWNGISLPDIDVISA